MKSDQAFVDRFWAKVCKTDFCWEWTSYKVKCYARITRLGKSVGAHRIAYELVKGPIPDGLVIDHLCRNSGCVNPDHLEAVTVRTNTMRGIGPSAVNAAKTSCNLGHPLTDGNLIHRKDGSKTCWTCHRAYMRGWNKENRAKINVYRKRWLDRHPGKMAEMNKKYSGRHKKYRAKKREEARDEFGT